MTARRPKDIGTAAESAVVKYLRENGWPHAERRALHGNVDLGDVTGTPGLVWEVKGGDAAKTASDGQILDWLHETDEERFNARAEFGFLITARYHKRVGLWWAHTDIETIANLTSVGFNLSSYHDVPVRLALGDLLSILRVAGYGERERVA